ncbi:hypothetical protein [Serinicoccus sediminis]|uniref:hypothetical protein n=1 Tax=Serinicoccus sediminis TaxID=2306021 RepID=UPI00101ECDFE|nr:hypothetical protein [Serinicoccus sediminis]
MTENSAAAGSGFSLISVDPTRPTCNDAKNNVDPYDLLTRALALARGTHASGLGFLDPARADRPHTSDSAEHALREIAGRLALLATSRTTVSVVSDDPIIREGLDTVLNRHGLLTWPSSVADAVTPSRGAWDYVLLWLPSREGIDPFASISHVARLSSSGVPVVTVYPGQITPLCRLRLSEAGARYALPQWWLSRHVESLSDTLARAELPAQFHLGTPLAIRQELGLGLDGQLEPLLDAAKQIPLEVWRNPEASASMLARPQVHHLRGLALRAGVPLPLDRYSTATRKAPSTPAWRDVHRVVRGVFNFRTQGG